MEGADSNDRNHSIQPEPSVPLAAPAPVWNLGWNVSPDPAASELWAPEGSELFSAHAKPGADVDQADACPHPGDPCVIMGRHLGESGRKTFTATTLYDSDGRILARARHTWITVDPSLFN